MKKKKMKVFLAGICTLNMLLSGVSVSAESDNVQANSTDSQSTEQSVVTEEEKLSEVGSATEEEDSNENGEENQNDVTVDEVTEQPNEESKTEIDMNNPENATGERKVIGVDENGNIFQVEEESDGVVDSPEMQSRASGTKIVNFRANASGTTVTDITTYSEYGTGISGYTYGRAGADAAYLGTENGKIKFMQSGVIGLVDASKVQVVSLGSVKSYSNYYANGNSIIHRICMDMTTPGYAASVTIGPQQSYMTTGTTYYSYDGHYFYTNYDTMISDYCANTRVNSINSNQPYYNYYQYLPLRGQSKYSANELNSLINNRAKNSSSKMYNMGSVFVNNQSTYGVNAMLMSCVGGLESAWGTSNIAKNKNNLFGLNAVDSSPGISADTYSSVNDCIKTFAETYMSKRYLRANYTYYHGGFLGNKDSGINVSYASDPYWGEKIAALAWAMDNEGGRKDQNKYSIGITNASSLAIRKEASTSSTQLYNNGKLSNYAFLILDEAGDFYKVQSDPVLDSGRTKIDTSTGVYNSSKMYAYTSKKYVSKVNSANDGTEERTTGIVYSAHVADIGWQAERANGNTAGTTGQNKQMEAVKIYLKDVGYSGSIEYSAHVADIGWQDWVADDSIAGTTGKNKQMEAIKIRLTGDVASHYDIYYRVHVQDYGWLDWAENGEIAGTTDAAKRMEAIQIKLVTKKGKAPGSNTQAYIQPILQYRAHVADIGWQKNVYGGGIAGTTGRSKQMEAIQIKLVNKKYKGSIKYQTHVQDYGWLDWTAEEEQGGTTGKGKRLEAIKIELTSVMAQKYDVYYRTHVADYGWLGWAKNGEMAGTSGCSKQVEAVQIILVGKGGGAPGSTDRSSIVK